MFVRELANYHTAKFHPFEVLLHEVKEIRDKRIRMLTYILATLLFYYKLDNPVA